MKSLGDMARIFLVVAFLVFITWLGYSRAVDRYRMCRQLGHGRGYCALAGLEHP